MMRIEGFLIGLVVIGTVSVSTEAQTTNLLSGNGYLYLDRWNYNTTVRRSDGFYDFGPEDWGDIFCDEENDLQSCLAYTDKWETGREWAVEKNYCRSCPANDTESCNKHHQSPINLQREVGFEPGTHDSANECIDVHWMKYEDSFCDLEQLIDADAFTIERHALRISQPITVYNDSIYDLDGVPDGVRLNCLRPGRGSRFGRIDFSKGFSQWWHLSHTDIHTPSEHTQEGIRYDAEIQLHHFYSVTAEEAEVNNEVATVSIFAQAYEDAVPFAFLDKVICEWRKKEYQVRTECGLDPINSTYPGCFPLPFQRERQRNLRYEKKETEKTGDTSKLRNAYDVILHNFRNSHNPNHTNVKLHMEESNWEPAEEKDWDTWIKEQSRKMDQNEELYHMLRERDHGGNHTEELHEQYRKLIQYDELVWHNYWPLIGVRTEYYFRYSGSQTIPPCYGNFVQNNRTGTNHWRVMKDPVRIHPRQLQEIRRLTAERIAPLNSTVNACKPDTAATVTRDVNDTSKILDVNNARPLQFWDTPHFKTFCECKDWPSKWPEDRKWCEIEDEAERFYLKPYNFDL